MDGREELKRKARRVGNGREELKGKGRSNEGMKKSWNERKEVTNGKELQRKDGRNEMDELKGKEEQDEQERRVEAKER